MDMSNFYHDENNVNHNENTNPLLQTKTKKLVLANFQGTIPVMRSIFLQPGPGWINQWL